MTNIETALQRTVTEQDSRITDLANRIRLVHARLTNLESGQDNQTAQEQKLAQLANAVDADRAAQHRMNEHFDNHHQALTRRVYTLEQKLAQYGDLTKGFARLGTMQARRDDPDEQVAADVADRWHDSLPQTSAKPVLLRPCPFCACNARLDRTKVNGQFQHRAICTCCGGQGPAGLTKEETINLWNKRTK